LSVGVQEAVDEAALLLSLSARPVIWAGGGAMGAGAGIARLAELLAAPVVTTTSGKGVISEDHPLAVGSLFQASEVARLLGGADAAVAVGTSFSDRSTRNGQLPMPMQLFHVDRDPSVPGRRYPTRLGITGDAREVLEALAAALESAASDGRAKDLAARRDLDAQAARVAEVCRGARDRLAAGGLKVELVLSALRRAIPPEVPTAWGSGPARWAVPLFRVPAARSFLAAPVGATPGWAVAAVAGRAEGTEPVASGPAVAVVTASELLAAAAELPALATAGGPTVVVAFEGEEWAGVWNGPIPGEPAAAPAGLAELSRRAGMEAVAVGDLEGLSIALAAALEGTTPTLVVVGGRP
jgi:thiamine pyrophosphate-dependent acetolactate synthase large subunit-like protein